MGRRGPTPTPTAELERRGSWRAGARKRAEPTAPQGRPAEPAGFADDELDVWRRTVDYIEALGMLARTDEAVVARYAQKLAGYWRDADTVRRLGPDEVVEGKDGRPETRERSAAKRMSRIEGELIRLEREFGLTPAARAGLGNLASGSRPGDGGILDT